MTIASDLRSSSNIVLMYVPHDLSRKQRGCYKKHERESADRSHENAGLGNLSLQISYLGIGAYRGDWVLFPDRPSRVQDPRWGEYFARPVPYRLGNSWRGILLALFLRWSFTLGAPPAPEYVGIVSRELFASVSGE